jgi:hypothetical protein
MLSEFAKQRVIISGRSTRSTSLNKQGATVSNYTVSRLGSELNSRLDKQRKTVSADPKSPLNYLLFVSNPDLVETDPIVDGEVTTLLGYVKSVRELSTSELFQHAMLDKFYKHFIDTGKIIFQPTVYADKTQFLNYRGDLSTFVNEKGDTIGGGIMHLYSVKNFEGLL